MDNKKREDRLTLRETRDKYFDKFRRNLRMLRVSQDISGTEFSKKVKLKNGARCICLEYGKANPTTDELIGISTFFKLSIDDLLNKDAKITFE